MGERSALEILGLAVAAFILVILSLMIVYSPMCLHFFIMGPNAPVRSEEDDLKKFMQIVDETLRALHHPLPEAAAAMHWWMTNGIHEANRSLTCRCWWISGHLLHQDMSNIQSDQFYAQCNGIIHDEPPCTDGSVLSFKNMCVTDPWYGNHPDYKDMDRDVLQSRLIVNPEGNVCVIDPSTRTMDCGYSCEPRFQIE